MASRAQLLSVAWVTSQFQNIVGRHRGELLELYVEGKSEAELEWEALKWIGDEFPPAPPGDVEVQTALQGAVSGFFRTSGYWRNLMTWIRTTGDPIRTQTGSHSGAPAAKATVRDTSPLAQPLPDKEADPLPPDPEPEPEPDLPPPEVHYTPGDRKKPTTTPLDAATLAANKAWTTGRTTWLGVLKSGAEPADVHAYYDREALLRGVSHQTRDDTWAWILHEFEEWLLAGNAPPLANLDPELTDELEGGDDTGDKGKAEDEDLVQPTQTAGLKWAAGLLIAAKLIGGL